MAKAELNRSRVADEIPISEEAGIYELTWIGSPPTLVVYLFDEPTDLPTLVTEEGARVGDFERRARLTNLERRNASKRLRSFLEAGAPSRGDQRHPLPRPQWEGPLRYTLVLPKEIRETVERVFLRLALAGGTRDVLLPTPDD